MHATIVLTVFMCVLTVLLTNTVHEVQSSPVQYTTWEEYVKMTKDDDFPNSKDNECREGGRIRNLCEKCAKVTRNELVYPLCCRRKMDVTAWCQEFLTYRPKEGIVYPSLSPST